MPFDMFYDFAGRTTSGLLGLASGGLMAWLLAKWKRRKEHQSILAGDARDTVVIELHIVETAVGADGSVWVATGHALNRFTGSSRRAYDVAQTMALHTDRRGTLWVAGAQKISRLVGDTLQEMAVPDVVRASRIMAITTDEQGTLWLCTALKGVMTWDGKTLSRFEAETERATKACQSIFTDSQGRVWIGFLTAGAAVHEDGKVRQFGPREGLPRGTVLAIIEDRRGGIWMSTSSGVRPFSGSRT